MSVEAQFRDKCRYVYKKQNFTTLLLVLGER